MPVFGIAEDAYAKRAIAAFRQRLAELGYVDGKSVVIDARYAEGSAQRSTELARDSWPARLTSSSPWRRPRPWQRARPRACIPIVMAHAGNPVAAGRITSLARPGGNVIGTTKLPLGGKLSIDARLVRAS